MWGQTRPLLYATIGSSWVVQLPFLFLAVSVFHLPLEEVWVSYVISELAHLCIALYHYKKGVWTTKRV